MKTFDDFMEIKTEDVPPLLPKNGKRVKLIKCSEIVTCYLKKEQVAENLLFHDHATKSFVNWLIEIEKPKANYTIEAEIYNVVKRAKENTGNLVANKRWYEYEVFLIKNGEIITSWDSFIESYPSSGQQLTKKECERAIKEIREDVESGNIKYWFNVE